MQKIKQWLEYDPLDPSNWLQVIAVTCMLGFFGITAVAVYLG